MLDLLHEAAMGVGASVIDGPLKGGGRAIALHFEPGTNGAVDAISIALNRLDSVPEGAGLLLGFLGSLENREAADWLANDDVKLAAGLCATCGDYCVEAREDEVRDLSSWEERLPTRNERAVLSAALDLTVIADQLECDAGAVERARERLLNLSEMLTHEARTRFE
jgi:hypothetical protein